MASKVKVTLGIDVQPTDGPRAWKLGHGELHQARHGTHRFCPDHTGEMQLRTHSSAEAGKCDPTENSERQRDDSGTQLAVCHICIPTDAITPNILEFTLPHVLRTFLYFVTDSWTAL